GEIKMEIGKLPGDQHAHTADMLLKQLRTKEITLDEFLTSCAYWGVKTLKDIYFKSLPTKPLEVFEYEQLSPYKRQKLTEEFYVDNPGVMRYYEERDRIIRINKTNIWRLKTYKKHIPESDTASHEKLDQKILDFKMKMRK
ncbi:MAG: hypothetical protein U9O91_06815, partial [Candidatus Caldatribacteriota bacterium]|nr:hypothetical protein [Candidatus Caldatribacteriota bacterium]